MEIEVDPEFQPGEDPLALFSGFPDVEIPLSSVHNLLYNSQLSFPLFDFSSIESKASSPAWQADASQSTDDPSGPSPAGLVENCSGILPNFDATCPPDDRLCRNPQGASCTNLATRVLGSMHPSSSSCILSMIGQGGERQPQLLPGADTVLSINQSALHTVRSILKCPCSASPQVLLLVTVICSSIGAAYRQVIDIYSQKHHANTSNVALPLGVGETEVRRRNLFIGNHRLGKEMETSLVHHILVGMLKELQIVVGDIACLPEHPPILNEPRSGVMMGVVRARLVAFLHTQVQALTSALDLPESDRGTVVTPVLRK